MCGLKASVVVSDYEVIEGDGEEKSRCLMEREENDSVVLRSKMDHVIPFNHLLLAV